MAYEKQTWVPYDDNKTEEENIQAGAVVTAEKMNYLETGLDEHDKNTTNPHKVTKAQVGLGNVANVEQATKTEFDSHTSSKTNPHSVTASQVGAYSKVESENRYAKPSDITKDKAGLGNVDNFATATRLDAEQGFAANAFMTPFRVKQQIDYRMATQDETNNGVSTEKIISPSTLKAALDALKSSYLLSKQEFVINSSNSNYIESGQIVFQRYWDEVFVTGVFKTKNQIPAGTSYLTTGDLPDWLKTDTNRNFFSKYDSTVINIYLEQATNIIKTDGAVIPAGKWVAVTSSSYPVRE
jgi:hypothetical protein